MPDHTEIIDSAAEQDERCPFYPVDTGNPIVAAMSVLIVIGLIAAMFLVVPK